LEPIHIAAWIIFLTIGMVISFIMDLRTIQEDEIVIVQKPKQPIKSLILEEYSEDYAEDSLFDMKD